MEFFSKIKFFNTTLNFIRFILSIKKSEIYDYSHRNNMPYLFDSTLKWSQLGQIRYIIRPNLIKWNKMIIDSFDDLVDTLLMLIECIDMLVDIWIKINFLLGLKMLDELVERINIIKKNLIKCKLSK